MTEKIIASIPVERVQVGERTYTYRTEIMEVEVLRYLRYRCGSIGAARNRFFYSAVIKLPDCVPRCYPGYGVENGRLTVNVIRSLNPRWKRPLFKDGSMTVDVEI